MVVVSKTRFQDLKKTWFTYNHALLVAKFDRFTASPAKLQYFCNSLDMIVGQKNPLIKELPYWRFFPQNLLFWSTKYELLGRALPHITFNNGRANYFKTPFDCLGLGHCLYYIFKKERVFRLHTVLYRFYIGIFFYLYVLH